MFFQSVPLEENIDCKFTEQNQQYTSTEDKTDSFVVDSRRHLLCRTAMHENTVTGFVVNNTAEDCSHYAAEYDHRPADNQMSLGHLTSFKQCTANPFVEANILNNCLTDSTELRTQRSDRSGHSAVQNASPYIPCDILRTNSYEGGREPTARNKPRSSFPRYIVPHPVSHAPKKKHFDGRASVAGLERFTINGRCSQRRQTKFLNNIRRLLLFLISLGAFVYLGFRLHYWFVRYRRMKTLFVISNEVDANPISIDSRLEANAEAYVLKICNINAFRGTSLFMLSNGTWIYDALSEMKNVSLIKQTTGRTALSHDLRLSADFAKKAGHKMDDMLKICRGSSKSYHSNEFSTILTKQGLCNLLQLAPDVHELEFLMDPQEYDYIVPDNNPAGFRILLFPNAESARAHGLLRGDTNQDLLSNLLQPRDGIFQNEAIVTPEFHSFLRFGVSFSDANFKCSSNPMCAAKYQLWNRDQSLSQDLFPVPIVTSQLKSTGIRIISTVQAKKSSMLYKTLSIQNPELFSRSERDVLFALRIKQRGYLRILNLTAFVTVQRFVPMFGDLRIVIDKTLQRLKLLHENLQKDQRYIETNHRNVGCSSDLRATFISLLNMTTEFRNGICILGKLKLLSPGGVQDCESIQSRQEPSLDDEKWQMSFRGVKNPDVSALKPELHFNSDDLFVSKTSRIELVELIVIDLLFTHNWSNSDIRDTLRSYLRTLSASTMKLRSKFNQNEDISGSDADGPICDRRMVQELTEKYKRLCAEVGEILAESIQRLESFMNEMGQVVQANLHVIREFKQTASEHTRLTSANLVSFTVQIEKSTSVGQNMLIPMASFVNVLSEIFGICLTTIGLLIPLLISLDYAFHRMIDFR